MQKNHLLLCIALAVVFVFAQGCPKRAKEVGGPPGGPAPTKGKPAAKAGVVTVVAYYPGTADHEELKKGVLGLEQEFPGKVSARFVNVNSDEGYEEAKAIGWSCGCIRINGKQDYDIEENGKKRTVLFTQREGGEWTWADLKAVIAQEIAKGGQPGAAAGEKAAAGAASGLTVLVPCGMEGPFKKAKEAFLQENPGLTLQAEPRNIEVMTAGVAEGKFEGDVFLSLGDREVLYLEQQGKIDGKAVPFAENSIALLVPTANPAGIAGFTDLGSAKVKTVGVVDPKIMSAGYYTEQALKKAKLYDAVMKKAAIADTPALVKGWAGSGKVEVAIIYGTCLTEAKKGGTTPSEPPKAKGLAAVPHEYYDPFFCTGAVLKGAKNPESARAFLEFLKTEPCQAAFEQFGYKRLKG